MTSAKEVTHGVVPRHRPVGCQWGKWDLHFHTPASFDYQDKSVSDQQIIDTLVGAELDLIAITDHHVMDVARIKRLQQIAADRISILPGIEFRSDLGGKDTIHLIGIFPEDCKLDDVWTKLSGKLELTPDDLKKKGGDEKIYVVFRDACDVIHDLGGIVSVHAGTKSNTIEKIGNKDLFKQYRQIRTWSPDRRSLRITEGRAVCLAAAYMRAKTLLQEPDFLERFKKKLESGQKFHAFVKKILARTGPKFIGELLVETQTRAARDSAFRSRINSALVEIEGLLTELPGSLPVPGTQPAPPPRPMEDRAMDDSEYWSDYDGDTSGSIEADIDCKSSTAAGIFCVVAVVVIVVVAIWG